MKTNFPMIVTLRTLGLFLVWLILSESTLPMHVGLGFVAAFVVAWLNTDRVATPRVVRRLRSVWYFIWLIGRILHSGVHLSKLILHPALPIDPKVIRYRTQWPGNSGIVLLGNSITLTPGTITVEVNDRELLIHAMDDHAAEDVTSHRLARHIDGLFGKKVLT